METKPEAQFFPEASLAKLIAELHVILYTE